MARTVGFEGLGDLNTTFLSALDSTAEGKPVKISASKTVDVAADAEVFHGKAIKVEKDGAVNVQIGGYVEFPYSGTAPKVGYEKLVSDGAGVKTDGTNGREYLVVMVDEVSKTVGILL